MPSDKEILDMCIEARIALKVDPKALAQILTDENGKPISYPHAVKIARNGTNNYRFIKKIKSIAEERKSHE